MSNSASYHTYRPAIDGLRAVAVVPVVLFHAGVPGLGGGYVGVDVFFVVSGYLITGILYREACLDRFSLARFYERRMRRIMPNLLAMLLATSLAAALVLIPIDYLGLAKSTLATLTFLANVWFYKHIGYFAPMSPQMPLLHMWSLGVEEQYYLLFPFLLVALVRHSRQALITGLVLIFAASFLLSLWQVLHARDAAFYLPFARLWELMTGSLLAVGAIPAVRSALAREIVAGGGLLAIAVAVFGFTESTPFPGFAALLPCLGAAALLHADESGPTRTGRILSSRFPVFIGLVSYSLYIWHWPVIVLTRYALQRALAPVEIGLVLMGIAILAVAAWQWIEKPMRNRALPTRRLLGRVAGGTTLLLANVGIILATHGLPQRYDPATRNFALASEDVNLDRPACDHPSLDRLARGDVCHVGPPGEPRFALVGDSFGDALAPGVSAAAYETGVPGVVMTFSGCAPLLAVRSSSEKCTGQVDAAWGLLAKMRKLDTVLLIARWPMLITGSRSGLFQQENAWLYDAQSVGTGTTDNRQVVARGIARSARAIGRARIVVVTGVPEQKVHVPQALSLAPRFAVDVAGVDRAAFNRRAAGMASVLVAAEADLGKPIHTLDLSTTMCNANHCPIADNGVALYADDNHPSRHYALKLAPRFVELLRTVPGAQ